MIRIKDYIFNENEINKIRFIPESTKILVDCFKNEDYIEIRKATFDDIEWNYSSKEIEYLYKRIEELENENRELDIELEKEKKAWKDMLDSRDNLCRRIGKAIEYIEELYTRYIADYSDIERLEKILKGEKNEN